MTHFEDNGDGSQSFIFNDWVVRIWPGHDNRIDVTAPGQLGGPLAPDHWVEVDADGIWVSGSAPGFGYHERVPSTFTIPWEVIAAIIEARATLGV